MTQDDYKKALKAGKKEFQSRLIEGLTPSLPVLDEVVSDWSIASEVNIGLVNIPLDQICGTKTFGRSQAFAANFMPLLGLHSEFAAKWISLGTSQEKEGIREPIRAYEFMNRFYVLEGNKRVSVMKFLEADSIPGFVTRILPRRSKDKDVLTYYEFLDFYQLSGFYRIQFRKPGDYEKLIRLLGLSGTEPWSDDERSHLVSLFHQFSSAFSERYKVKDGRKISEAFLSFLTIYNYQDLKDASHQDMLQHMQACDKEFKAFQADEQLLLHMDPAPEKKSLFPALLPLPKKCLRAAFVYDKEPEDSPWNYAHELGRLYLEQTFPEEIETVTYICSEVDQVEDILAKADDAGCDMIFTTSPAFITGCIKAAVEHPKLRIFNCSLTTPHRTIRSYYTRMYEVKFLMGIIAGAMAKEGRIYYLADYPINGTIACINAFALGAKMVNPRAKIWLDWTSVKKKTVDDLFGFEVYSGKDIGAPGDPRWHTGLYRLTETGIERLAIPIYHWGKFYEKLLCSVLDGIWEKDEKKETKAIHYWWGMSAGVLELFFSKNLPIGTRRLIEFLQKQMIEGTFNPFGGILYSQEGVVQETIDDTMCPEDIASMNWLAENVIGSIPLTEEVKQKAIPIVEEQGVKA